VRGATHCPALTLMKRALLGMADTGERRQKRKGMSRRSSMDMGTYTQPRSIVEM